MPHRLWLSALALHGLLLATPGAAVPVSVGLSFTAATLSDSGYIPPDTMGAVGEDHIVQFINGLFQVFDKEDGSVVESMSSGQFWAEQGLSPTDNFDPRVTYDPFAQRWYALETNERQSPDNAYFFAVSDTSDPTGDWSAFSIDADATDTYWADYPMLGFNADAVYISSNMFDNAQDTLTHTSVVVLPMADLLGPTPTVANLTEWQTLPISDVNFTPQQTIDLDGAGGSAYMVSETGVPALIQLVTIDDPGGTPTLGGLGAAGLIFVDPAAGGTPLAAEQPGMAQPLDVISERFTSNLVLQNGSLWGTRMVNTVGGETTAQWFEIDPETRTVIQSGLISEEGLNLIYPSIAVNDMGQVVIGFTGVGEDEFASAYAIVGETIAGATVFGDLLLLQEGVATYEQVFDDRNRWGDYSATVVDPTDPSVFWTFQEWVIGPNEWAIQITQLLLIPEPSTALLLALGLALIDLGRRRGRNG